MTHEAKRLVVRTVVQFACGIAVAAVVTSALKAAKPVGLDKLNNFVYEIGTWSISSLVAEVTSEHIGKVFDGFFPDEESVSEENVVPE